MSMTRAKRTANDEDDPYAHPTSSRVSQFLLKRKQQQQPRRRAAAVPTTGTSMLSLLAIMTTVLTTSVYRGGEALASSSHSRFASGGGQKLPPFVVARGGSTATTTTTVSSSETLKCVMQQQVPPPGLNGNNNNFGVVKKNGRKNGAAAAATDADAAVGGRRSTNGFPPHPAAAAANNNGGFADGNKIRIKTTTNKPPLPVEYVAETKLPSEIGDFMLRGYRVPGAPMGQEPAVIYSAKHPPMMSSMSAVAVAGGSSNSVPVRIHDQCLTSEVFGSQRCDCKEQLNMALRYIDEHGGVVVYLQQEGRGIGLANKIAAYALQDGGMDTVDANLHLGFPEDNREYSVVPHILKDLGLDSIQLMTNNPRKVRHLQALGVNVEKTVPMVVPSANPHNRRYLETKITRMHHENLATLLSQTITTTPDDDDDAADTTTMTALNGFMAPRRKQPKKHIAEHYINNGTEMSANAVQMSLLVEQQQLVAVPPVDENDEQAGVTALQDGYCFGRQSVEDAIAAVARGEMVVVVDDLNRENEGDFIMAADHCKPEDMARIVRYSSGVVCIALEGKRMDELELPPMLVNNQDPKGTAFSVTVDATKEHGITTGISAGDRATTMQLLADPASRPTDFHRPGHVFPLRAREGGVLARDGHTEASVDLARMAGCNPAGVLCEIVSEENPTEMMRLPEIKRFCAKHGYVLTSIVDMQQYRRDTEQQQEQ